MNRITEREERAAREHAEDLAGQRILGMTPDGKTGASIEAVLRRRIEEISEAIRDKDVDRLMPLYARDVEVFDVRGSLNVSGAGAYRGNFEKWFDSFEGRLSFETHNLRITAAENAAFCHYLALVTGARAGGRTSGYWVRGTTCFERRDGEWLVTHEHISMPASM
jgi:ketosteroid isomerase-like protein